ncbi:hypothetical protein C8039_07780 [Halogeometricum sp. wsp3]|nr:hypothetical protein C8039_07780 [Halogeometricum sp. wsp3]
MSRHGGNLCDCSTPVTGISVRSHRRGTLDERCVSIRSNDYKKLTRYGDDSTSLYVCRKDRRSPEVYQFQLGDFAESRCAVLPPRDDVGSITNEQHTVPLNRARGVYYERNYTVSPFSHSCCTDSTMLSQLHDTLERLAVPLGTRDW